MFSLESYSPIALSCDYDVRKSTNILPKVLKVIMKNLLKSASELLLVTLAIAIEAWTIIGKMLIYVK